MKTLELRSVGIYNSPTKSFNLEVYYVDRCNNLYSRNPSTWELSKRKGYDILKCSNSSTNSAGYIKNSIYSKLNGNKVTLLRKNITFDTRTTPIETYVIEPKLKGRKMTLLGVLK